MTITLRNLVFESEVSTVVSRGVRRWSDIRFATRQRPPTITKLAPAFPEAQRQQLRAR
jgi:hypothetical protein